MCDNFAPGDEIILLGFSRGAFTARSVASIICKLGILNRIGLQKLPEIFLDYQMWEDWKPDSVFNKETHLTAFTPEILKRLRILRHEWNGDELENERKLHHDVVADREQLFNNITQKSTTQEKAAAYRKLLCQVFIPNFGITLVYFI